MSEFLSKFDGGELIGLITVLGGVCIAVIALVANQWRRVRVAELEAGLKQQMIDRGMSPAEIEQLLAASQDGKAQIVSTGDEAADKAALAQRMVDNGYEAKDIERVLSAYQHGRHQPV
jgi:SOS response regulatory protein OraA/RecX